MVEVKADGIGEAGDVADFDDSDDWRRHWRSH
jgi:hypothetical protein